VVVLGDFELATQINDLDQKLTIVGSLLYMAPEILSWECKYGIEVNIWSASIVFVELVEYVKFTSNFFKLFGQFPFRPHTIQALQAILEVFAGDKEGFFRTMPKFPALWSKCKHLIFSMLECNPNKHIIATQTILVLKKIELTLM
jgi:serine/threonine protein kinase